MIAHNAQIKFFPDRKNINADGKDLSYVTLTLLDNNGIKINYPIVVNLYVSGEANIVRIENSENKPIGTSKSSRITAGGEENVIIVIQAGVKPNIVALTGIAYGFKNDTVKIKIKKIPFANLNR